MCWGLVLGCVWVCGCLGSLLAFVVLVWGSGFWLLHTPLVLLRVAFRLAQLLCQNAFCSMQEQLSLILMGSLAVSLFVHFALLHFKTD